MLEGNRFIVERLYSGAILNSKTFFIEDFASAEITAAEESLIYELDQEALENLREDSHLCNRFIILWQNKVF